MASHLFVHETKTIGVMTTLIAITLLAGNGYFAKGLDADVLTLTFLRSVIAAISIYIFVKVKRQGVRLDCRRDYTVCYFAGFLLGVHWLCFFYAMRVSTVTIGMTTLYTYPIMTLWLESIMFKKKVKARDWVNKLIVVIGILLIGVPEMLSFNQLTGISLENSSNNLLGVGLGLASAACFAARNILQQQFLTSYLPHKTIIHQVTLISCLMLMFFGVKISHKLSLSLAINEGLQWVLLGVFFTALPHSLIASGIKHIGAKSVSIIGCLQPVIGAVIAYFMLNELSSSWVVIGCMVVMLGAVLEIYYQGKLNPNR